MSIFGSVKAVRPPRSPINLSTERLLTADMGLIYPIYQVDCVPGDKMYLSNELVIRMMPLVAPIMHEIRAYIYYFFVPYRILWDQFEDFITRGQSGDMAPVMPTWTPTGVAGGPTKTDILKPGQLWDNLTFPTDVVNPEALPGPFPIDFPRRAYYMIWNEYFRDQNLQSERDFTKLTTLDGSNTLSNELLMYACWQKDYFTSALPWQQRGTAPALPIVGTANAVFNGPVAGNLAGNSVQFDGVSLRMEVGAEPRANLFKNWLGQNTIDLAAAAGLTISDLRTAIGFQHFRELSARTGARYTEFLRATYGDHPRDERLQRPEFVGGAKVPIIISEVLQTSSSDTTSPQGNMAGHGITVNRQRVSKYRVHEFGILMGLMVIRPKPAYQQGINRAWLRTTNWDYYNPLFAGFSEQSVKNVELFYSNSDVVNNNIFGFQGRYNEYRYLPNTVHGLFRTTLSYWHLGRQWNPGGATPRLNEDFVKCMPSKRIFAVQNEPGFLCHVGTKVKAIRPMHRHPVPGMTRV